MKFEMLPNDLRGSMAEKDLFALEKITANDSIVRVNRGGVILDFWAVVVPEFFHALEARLVEAVTTTVTEMTVAP